MCWRREAIRRSNLPLCKAGISCALGPMAKRVESGARQWKATRLTLEWQQALMGRVELSACFSGLRSEQILKIASETKRNETKNGRVVKFEELIRSRLLWYNIQTQR